MLNRCLSDIAVLVLLALALGLPCDSARSQAAAQPDVDRSLIRELSKERLADSDTVLGFAAEGAALYSAESVKLTGYQYCGQAVALAEAGEFRQSLRAASKALYLAVDGQNEDLLSLAYRDLAIVMSYAGELAKAELFAREALKHPAQNPAIVAGPAYKVIADVEVRRRRFREAVEAYDQAASVSSERFKPLVLASLANALIDSGDLLRARAVIATVKLTDRNAALEAQFGRTRARLLLAEGRLPEALQAYQVLATTEGGSDSAYQRLWALEGASNAQLALGNKRAAADELTRALDSLDTVRARFRSEEIKLGLFADFQSLFERAIGLYLDLNDGPRALDASEKSRARAYLDSVRGRAPAASPTFNASPVAATRSLLAPDERVLEFHSLPDRLAVWVISRDAVELRTVAKSRTQLTEDVEALRYAITNGLGSAIAKADAIGAEIIAPLGLTAGQRLVVVPHGPLHYLPFQALRVGGAYLVERHPIAAVPSLGIAAQLLARGSVARAQLTAFGNPQIAPQYDLPGAQREVTELVGVFSGAASFLGADATKSRFKQVAPDSRMLHVAAHAKADLVDPLHSQILLATENNRQSFLEADEILALDLSKVSLVTLSACDSALGRVASGDEVLGFPRSFLSAGVASMIASLWPVADEATSVLMTTTYQQLHQGIDLQAAMQAGQLAVMRQNRFAHPFFWAPFNVIGNWRLTFSL